MIIEDGPADAPLTLLFAHGAGAPMDSPFLAAMASRLASRGPRVVRFEFPYMAQRRAGGPRRPPDPMPVLEAAFLAHLAGRDPRRLVLAGKSLGGRVASRIAERAGAAAVVCFGYPFHPPGKPDRLRTAHLEGLGTPTLIVQGTRDPLGSFEEVEGYRLSPAIRLCWIEDGDHSLKSRKRTGGDPEAALDRAADEAAAFLAALPAPPVERP